MENVYKNAVATPPTVFTPVPQSSGEGQFSFAGQQPWDAARWKTSAMKLVLTEILFLLCFYR